MTVYRRLTLRDGDDQVFLDRWGFGVRRLGTIYLHRMEAPDPGVDLHDHPWSFVTIVLKGGYVEQRESIRDDDTPKIKFEHRRPLRPRLMRLDECHTIARLLGKVSWSLVITGPVRRSWGFYTPDGWMHHNAYEDSPHGQRRAASWTSNYKSDGVSEAMR